MHPPTEKPHRSAAKARFASSILAMTLLATPVLALDYGDINPDLLPPGGFPNITWSDPGSWITIDVTTHGLPANNTGIDATEKVEDIIASTSGNRVLYFPDGAYYFKSDLAIATSNIRLKGSGKLNTIFVIDGPASEIVDLGFEGGTSGSALAVTGSLAKGATMVTLSNASTLSAGDFVFLYAANWTFEGEVGDVSQIFKIVSKSGNTLTLDLPLGVDIPSDKSPVVQKFNMVSNVGVEDLKITRLRDNADFSANVEFRYVYNGRAINLDSGWCANSHISATYSKNIVFEHNEVHDAYDFGEGGHGYGLNVNFSTGVRISDNKTWNLRHQILLAKGSNHCVVSYNSVEPPMYGLNAITLHGRYPHSNLIEGNYSNYKMLADSAHLDNGPRNVFFRNFSDSERIGNEDPNTSKTAVIGNVMGALLSYGTDNYAAANKINGTVAWGALDSSSDIPDSLYTTTKPGFLGAKPWPVYGPGVDSNWGTGNVLPAAERPRPSINGGYFECEEITKTTSDSTSNYTDAAASGDRFNSVTSNAVGDHVTYTMTVPQAGSYSVTVRDRIAYNKGIYQLSIGGVNQGSPVDQYGATTGFRESKLGNVIFSTAGNKQLRFQVTGKNGSSSGFALGFDYIDLTRSFIECEDLPTATSQYDTNTDYTAGGASRGKYNSANLNAMNDYVEYTVNVPETGTYTIYVKDRIAKNKGKYQLTIDGINQGSEVDQYGDPSTFRESSLGLVTLNTSGNKLFRFTVTGQNGNSDGFALGFDYIDLVKN
jgi:hypothetical protein